MRVFLRYDAEKNLIWMSGRFDPPYAGNFRSAIRPGEEGFGKTFEELKLISSVETDPLTQKVVSIFPLVKRPENPPPFPDQLLKRSSQP